MNKNNLTDNIGRTMKKLRVSLTDTCNFRCFYCMPLNPVFMPNDELLSPQEIFDICQNLLILGFTEIRLTGGEPLMRPELREIVSKLSKLNLKKFGMTTNGFRLNEEINFLKEHKCQYINVSLDSLQENKFNEITRSTHFQNVLANILLAKKNSIKIKINTLLFKGKNDDEVFDFINFSAKYKIPIRFLELIKRGPFHNEQRNLFIPAEEIIKKIEAKIKLTPKVVAKDSTSFMYTTKEGAEIGFIASESKPFCGNCSRLRLTAKGKLKSCLMSEDAVDLRGKSLDDYPALLKKTISMKPTDRIKEFSESMHKIGG